VSDGFARALAPERRSPSGAARRSTRRAHEVPRARRVTLLDLLDRLLGGGVLVHGQIMLAAADIDLVELDLGLLLSSVDELREPDPDAAQSNDTGGQAETLPPVARRRSATAGNPRLPERVNSDSERLEKGLAQLVLTVIELLRQLMERQALRRVDGGALTEEEVERLGRTFSALAQRMDELKEIFGLTDEELNLNLGPLGDLM
jgi:hypothetical protein